MKRETGFPKVAIVSANPICEYVSNGIMMRSLFAGWPKEQLAQFYFPLGGNYPPDLEAGVEYHKIQASGRVWRISPPPNELEIRSKCTDRPVVAPRQGQHRLVASLRRTKGLFAWTKLVQEAWYGHSWIGRVLCRELADFQPDIVYALLGNYSLTKNTVMACKNLKIPLFLHVADDYVRAFYEPMPFGSRLADCSERWFQAAVDYADGLAGISGAMAEEYANRYGGCWTSFTTGAITQTYDSSPRVPDGTICFTYTGNLGLGRWQQLCALAKSLQTIDDERGNRVRLEVYSSQEQLSAFRGEFAKYPVLVPKGWVPSQELPRVLHQADVLVHVESFDPLMISRTRLSLSTKLNQYMMAGRCLIGFGPPNLASMQLIKDAGAGLIASNPNGEDLTEQVRHLCSNAIARQAYGRAGREWAEHWGNTERERERFHSALKDAQVASRCQLRLRAA